MTCLSLNYDDKHSPKSAILAIKFSLMIILLGLTSKCMKFCSFRKSKPLTASSKNLMIKVILIV